MLEFGDVLRDRRLTDAQLRSGENDLCRANAAKARKRASSLITLAYINVPIMYFFLGPILGTVVACQPT